MNLVVQIFFGPIMQCLTSISGKLDMTWPLNSKMAGDKLGQAAKCLYTSIIIYNNYNYVAVNLLQAKLDLLLWCKILSRWSRMFESEDDGWSTCIWKNNRYSFLVKTPLIAIEIFRTECLPNLSQSLSFLLSNLSIKCTFCAHTYIDDGNLCITARSHIV